MNANITKETKLASYHEVLKTLGERQQMVIDYLYNNGDMTASELAHVMYNDDKIISPERNMVQPRLNELVKLGIVKVIGKRLDTNTSRQVSVYEIKK